MDQEGDLSLLATFSGADEPSIFASIPFQNLHSSAVRRTSKWAGYSKRQTHDDCDREEHEARSLHLEVERRSQSGVFSGILKQREIKKYLSIWKEGRKIDFLEK